VWVTLALLATLAGAWVAVDWWSRWGPSPVIRTVELRGLERLSAADIRRALPFQEGDRLFGASLDEAARRLSAHPWIAQATLYRSLSGTVVVRIRERQPAAVVSEGAREGEAAWYVDREGVLLGPAGERPGPSTLAVRGVSVAQLRAGSPTERRRLREGLALLALVRRDGVDAAEVTVRREGEAVVAFGGWRLHVRTGHYEEQWRRFWQVAERIPVDPRKGDRRVREIDLRFANSVVVRM
jgi:cell division protein FtsQ